MEDKAIQIWQRLVEGMTRILTVTANLMGTKSLERQNVALTCQNNDVFAKKGEKSSKCFSRLPGG
jgi:hypothetical protein